MTCLSLLKTTVGRVVARPFFIFHATKFFMRLQGFYKSRKKSVALRHAKSTVTFQSRIFKQALLVYFKHSFCVAALQ